MLQSALPVFMATLPPPGGMAIGLHRPPFPRAPGPKLVITPFGALEKRNPNVIRSIANHGAILFSPWRRENPTWETVITHCLRGVFFFAKVPTTLFGGQSGLYIGDKLWLVSVIWFPPQGAPRPDREHDDARTSGPSRAVCPTTHRSCFVFIRSVSDVSTAFRRLAKEKRRTAVVKKTLNPQWQETFTFAIKDPHDQTVYFDVKDANDDDCDNDEVTDDLLGRGTFDAGLLLPNDWTAAAMTLQPEAGAAFYEASDRGTLKAQLAIIERDGAEVLSVRPRRWVSAAHRFGCAAAAVQPGWKGRREQGHDCGA